MSDLKHNAKAVQSALDEKGDRLVANKPVSIIVPARFVDKNFLVMGEETQVLGLFLYVLGDKSYAYSNAPAMVSIDPDDMKDIILDDEPCIQFFFEKGSTVFKTVHLIQSDKLLYYIYREFVSMGNVPRYMDYLTFSRIFENATYFTGVKLASTITITHLLISLVARNPKNKQEYFRTVGDGKNYNTVAYEGVRSVAYGANNDVARMIGGHFADKMVTAMITENKETQEMEAIWRS